MRGRRRWAASVVFAAGVAGAALGCGETKYDAYLRGLEVEGHASRGPCKLEYADNSQAGSFMTAATISGDQVAECLDATKEAVAIYEKVAAMGYEDADFRATHTAAKEKVERLTQMLANIREMERDAHRPPGS